MRARARGARAVRVDAHDAHLRPLRFLRERADPGVAGIPASSTLRVTLAVAAARVPGVGDEWASIAADAGGLVAMIPNFWSWSDTVCARWWM